MAVNVSNRVAALSYIRNWTPVLMLHEVLPDSTPELPYGAVTQSGLRNILLDFTARGYSSGTLNDMVGSTGLASREFMNTGKKRLVLTFDDGTSDFMEYALPVLQELNFKATLFIVAGKIGDTRDWLSNHGGSALTKVPLMNAKQLLDLHRLGFTIGSHTYSHSWMPTTSASGHPGLASDELRREVTLSRIVLSDLIGECIDWFAYPYLAADRRVCEAVREAGYRGACGGPNRRHELYYINRIDAAAYSLPKLRMRCSGLFHITRQLTREMRGKSKSA